MDNIIISMHDNISIFLTFNRIYEAGSQDTGRVPAQESKGHVKIDFNWVFIHLRKMTAKKKKDESVLT